VESDNEMKRKRDGSKHFLKCVLCVVLTAHSSTEKHSSVLMEAEIVDKVAGRDGEKKRESH
jgi:hypothetical protein